MAHYYAQIDAQGVALAVTQAAAEIKDPSLVLLAGFDTFVIGKRWTGTHWQAIPQPEPEHPRHITKTAFRRRFTKAERTAIEWAAVDRADAPLAQRQMAAALRSDLKDQEQATYVDLDSPDVAQGLQQLATFELLQPHRPQEILSAPVHGDERPTL